MEYRFLGRSGLRVSALCLGAMTFGREADEQTSHSILNRFAEAGGNFIDTADAYSAGLSEQIVGKWLRKQRRDDWVIATKVYFPVREGVNEIGLSRKHILSAVEQSLKRLQTDYIDLYQVHGWDDSTDLDEMLSTLDQLVRDGKVRYLGASNFSGWQLQKSIDRARELHLEPFVSLQPQYNLLCRSTEWELIPVCEREGLGVLPWSPLRGGWLSGKYRRGMSGPPEGTRVAVASEMGWREAWENYNDEHTWQIIDALFEVAEEIGRTPAQVAINWLLQKPAVTAPIIGVRNLAQLNDNLGAAEFALTAEQVEQLDRASQIPLPYPYEAIERAQEMRRNYR